MNPWERDYGPEPAGAPPKTAPKVAPKVAPWEREWHAPAPDPEAGLLRKSREKQDSILKDQQNLQAAQDLPTGDAPTATVSAKLLPLSEIMKQAAPGNSLNDQKAMDALSEEQRIYKERNTINKSYSRGDKTLKDLGVFGTPAPKKPAPAVLAPGPKLEHAPAPKAAEPAKDEFGAGETELRGLKKQEDELSKAMEAARVANDRDAYRKAVSATDPLFKRRQEVIGRLRKLDAKRADKLYDALYID